MPMTRRDFVKQAITAPAAMPAIAHASWPVQTRETINPLAVRVGMTDWNLGQRGDITRIALAREIGLDGIQVSLQFPTDGKTPTLRDPKIQAASAAPRLRTASRFARSPSARRGNPACRCTPTLRPPSCSSRP
jgi:phage terminase small subunit